MFELHVFCHNVDGNHNFKNRLLHLKVLILPFRKVDCIVKKDEKSCPTARQLMFMDYCTSYLHQRQRVITLTNTYCNGNGNEDGTVAKTDCI